MCTPILEIYDRQGKADRKFYVLSCQIGKCQIGREERRCSRKRGKSEGAVPASDLSNLSEIYATNSTLLTIQV